MQENVGTEPALIRRVDIFVAWLHLRTRITAPASSVRAAPHGYNAHLESVLRPLLLDLT